MNARLLAVTSGIAVGALCAALIGIPQDRALEQQVGLLWLFQLRGPAKPPDQTILVLMSQQAASSISLPRDADSFHRCEDTRFGTPPATHVSLPTMPSRWPRCLHARLLSNYGIRVDCYAWGENVGTATSTPAAPFATNEYTLDFYGTSGASAIIAGAALRVQGMAMASLGYRLKPSRLGSVLANQAAGARCDDPANFWIGVMPDLRAIINSGAIGSVPLLVPPQR